VTMIPFAKELPLGFDAVLDVTVELIVFVSEGLCDGDAVFDREIDLLCVVVGAAVDVPDEDSLIVDWCFPSSKQSTQSRETAFGTAFREAKQTASESWCVIVSVNVTPKRLGRRFSF